MVFGEDLVALVVVVPDLDVWVDVAVPVLDPVHESRQVVICHAGGCRVLLEALLKMDVELRSKSGCGELEGASGQREMLVRTCLYPSLLL